ncbi:hypothetical protein C8J24_0617 [Sphingomonas aerolata]|uniref:Uncharacterized protein n=1 Tax=Sphingomonas aerolata TaxID=185951 RepID=A0A2T4YTU2_9SPHN|nr:hypothetical protein [Sphingomonas aerolata]PTM47230.1 hypothetical protein C8J24_0617 [Sphingomonas aerolata]
MTDLPALKDQIASFTGKTLASQLRVLMPDIDSRVREGVDHETIVEGLTKAGLPISLNTFRVYLYRYRLKARASKIEPLVEIVRSEPEPNTDRNIVTDPKPMADDNPPSDLPETEPNTVAVDSLSLTDLLDAKKSDAYIDQYMNRRPRLLGRNRGQP